MRRPGHATVKTIFRFFAERHLLANLFTLIVLLLGVTTLTRIQRDTYPTVDFGEVIIQTVYSGASPEDVELKVTNRIEEEIEGVTGLKDYVSYSFENMSFILVRIDPDENDQEKVKRDLRDAVDRVTDFPPEVDESPLITELKTTVFPVIEVGLAGEIPYRDLRELARDFERRIESLPGVTRVDRFGYRAREIQVEVDPERLKAYQLSLREIIAAVQSRNVRSTGGSFESYTSERNIVTLAQFREALEVGDCIVRATFEGPLIRINDLAVVRDDFEDETVASRMNGVSAISFLAYKSENADIVRTVGGVKELVAAEQERLPEGVEILVTNDTSRYVRNRFSIVLWNGIIGLVLVVIMLALFLNVRMALWVAVGIPVALLGTIALLPLFDVFLDSITLTSMVLVLGIIVDDAIIISESIYRRHEEGLEPLDAGVEGLYRVFRPVMTTILTTFLAFAPMFFMPGMMGKFVYVIPLTVTVALALSLAEAVVALPAHLVRGLQRRRRHAVRPGRVSRFERLRTGYARFVRRFLGWRYALVALFLGLLAGSLWYAANFIDFVLFPSSAADQIYARVQLPVGTSLSATSDKVKEVEEVLSAIGPSEIASFTTRVGIDDLIVQNEIEHIAVLSVSLTPFGERSRTADEIIEDIRQRAAAIEGIDDLFFEVDAGGPPVGRPITLRVVGPNDTHRTRLADDITAFLREIPGAKDIDRDDKPGKEQHEIKLDYPQLARLGLSVADVAQNVRIAYDGEVVTTVRYGDEDVDFRVQFNRAVRENEEALGDLAIPNRDGRLIPLRRVARLEVAPGPNNYYHYNGDRAITIEGDVAKGEITPVGVTRRVMEKFSDRGAYPGTRIVVGGEADETTRSVMDLVATFAIAVLAIYFLLILLFNSFAQPMVVVLSIPFGLIGVILAFATHGKPFGFLAMMGVIGLSGVVVNDALVLVNHINELRRQRPEDPVRDVVADATGDRLRAIIMTSLTTVVGLLPLAYGLGGNDPYMSPMALALGWGIFFATPLTLVLVPSLYLVMQDLANLHFRTRD